MGIIGYGGYFWLAHNVQELANESARAAIAGLTADEPQTLANKTLTSEIADYIDLSAKDATLICRGERRQLHGQRCL